MRFIAVLSFLVALLSAPLQANAWGAIASNGVISFTVVNGDSESAVIEQAMEGCQSRGSGCDLALAPSNGGAFVIYVGEGGLGFGFDPAPAKADTRARTACQKSYKKCKFANAFWDGGANWFALAMSQDNYGTARNFSTRESAEEKALEMCEKDTLAKGTCKIDQKFVTSQRVYFARADSESAEASRLVSMNSPEAAEAAALKECAAVEGSPRDCKITQRLVNDGPQVTPPASFKPLAAKVAKAETDRAKAVKSAKVTQNRQLEYSCQTRCRNQACESTFSDGKTIKWTAPMVFEFGQWKIDTSSCGIR